MTNPEQTDLERELRAAGQSYVRIPLPGDAWQQNQRRLAASRRRRGSRLVLAAAAVVALLLVSGLMVVATGGGNDSTPASRGKSEKASGDDVFAARNLLGPIVEVETLQIGGVATAHEAVLSDTTGKGPSLCDRYVAQNNTSSGCTSREPHADDAGVAFDWLTGTSGSGDIRGVLAGVDRRALKVQVWMDNGDMTLATLKPGGWEGTKLFALTVPADGPRPQRLVAYSDASGTVLQSVDLPDRFGDGWLKPVRACRGGGTGGTGVWPQPGSGDVGGLTVDLGWSDANISQHDASDSRACVDLGPGAIAGWYDFGRPLVVVVGPEAVMVEVRRNGTVLAQVKAAPSQASPYQVAVLRNVPSARNGTQLVAIDTTGHVIDRAKFVTSY